MYGTHLPLTPDVASLSSSLEAILKPLDLAQPPLDYAMSRLAGKGGLALEFGVAGGASLRTIVASRKFSRVIGFDCWTGLPHDWVADWVKGSFSQGGVPPDVHGAELVSGLFEDTVPPFLGLQTATCAWCTSTATCTPQQLSSSQPWRPTWSVQPMPAMRLTSSGCASTSCAALRDSSTASCARCTRC